MKLSAQLQADVALFREKIPLPIEYMERCVPEAAWKVWATLKVLSVKRGLTFTFSQVHDR